MARKAVYGSGSLDGSHPTKWYGRWRPEGARNAIRREVGPKKTRECPDGLTKPEAQRKLQRMMAGEDVDALPQNYEPGRTVELVGQQLLVKLAAKNRKKSSRETVEGHLRNHIAPYFPGRQITAVDDRELERFEAHLRKKKAANKDTPLAPKTVENIMTTMGEILEYALKKKWITSNPARMLEKTEREEVEADIHFLTWEETEAALRAVPDYYRNLRKLTWDQIQYARSPENANRSHCDLARELGVSDSLMSKVRRGVLYTDDREIDELRQLIDRTIILAAVLTGMRKGELIALRWKDIGWGEFQIRIRRGYTRGEFGRPKSKKSVRHVQLLDELAAALDELSRRTPWNGDDDLVFAHPLTGNPLDGSDLLKRFKKFCAIAGVPPHRFHDLRHSFGTMMAAAGVPLRVLQEWFGHANSATTDIYRGYQQNAHEKDMAEAALTQARAAGRSTQIRHKIEQTEAA